ncbi:hypothetical protein EB810_10020 [Altererythrobacter sp. FM1]|nr:hypothetical protein EB810_10020 [Altererythrobacter sp. FM1]
MPDAPEIPLDIRIAMRDCIMAIFWPRKDIIRFLADLGCDADLLPPPDTDLPRHAIIDDVFSALASRPDRGHAVFQPMIDALAHWTHFDPYYFDKLAKLDRAEARKKIAHLKSAVEQRNSSTTNRRAAASRAKQTQSQANDLAALNKAFTQIYGKGLTPQARGKLFEKFLQELFNRQSVKMRDPFRIVGEEIDGTFKFEGENYIVEAKWQDSGASTEQLYKFAYKVDGKMQGRGLFISVNGFSNEALRAVVHGKMIKTILMDGGDLAAVLEQRISLEAMLDYKIRAAQTRGEVYVCALREVSKV